MVGIFEAGGRLRRRLAGHESERGLEHHRDDPDARQRDQGLACSEELDFSDCASGDAAFHRIEDLARARRPRRARKIANGAAALPHGRFASVSRDLSLRIWWLDGTDEHPSPHAHSIKRVAVSADGGSVATAPTTAGWAASAWSHGVWSRATG
jgi:hypothetical protein